MPKKTFTTFEVGEICGVYPTTVINWIKQKKLPAFVTPGGHRRIQREQLVGFLKKFRFPIPADLSGSRRRVLIVDDDRASAETLRRAYQESKQFDAAVISNGIEALVSVGKRPPDLVILDAVMPIVDGSTVCSTLRSNPDTRHIKILAVAGRRLPQRSAKLLRSHSDGLFQKPLDAEALLRRAAELLKVELNGHALKAV